VSLIRWRTVVCFLRRAAHPVAVCACLVLTACQGEQSPTAAEVSSRSHPLSADLQAECGNLDAQQCLMVYDALNQISAGGECGLLRDAAYTAMWSGALNYNGSLGSVWGSGAVGSADIELGPRAFTDPYQLALTIAHEAGHNLGLGIDLASDNQAERWARACVAA
jgi:hypothetical protein